MPLPYVTPNQVKSLEKQVEGKQDALVSGVNIKTINNESILGEGNINISGGTEVVANPVLEDNEKHLNTLEIDGTKYNLNGETYERDDIYSDITAEYRTNRYVATKLEDVEFTNDDGDFYVSTETLAEPGHSEKTTEVSLLNNEGDLLATAQISIKAETDIETGASYSEINIKGDDELGATINIGGEADQVNINGQPFSNADSTLEFDTVAELYSYLTSNNISYCPIMISDIGNAASPTRFTKLGVLNPSTPQVIGMEGITDILTYFGNSENSIYQKTFNTKSYLCVIVGKTQEF